MDYKICARKFNIIFKIVLKKGHIYNKIRLKKGNICNISVSCVTQTFYFTFPQSETLPIIQPNFANYFKKGFF